MSSNLSYSKFDIFCFSSSIKSSFSLLNLFKSALCVNPFTSSLATSNSFLGCFKRLLNLPLLPISNSAIKITGECFSFDKKFCKLWGYLNFLPSIHRILLFTFNHCVHDELLEVGSNERIYCAYYEYGNLPMFHVHSRSGVFSAFLKEGKYWSIFTFLLAKLSMSFSRNPCKCWTWIVLSWLFIRYYEV